MDKKIDEISKLGGTPLVVAARDTSMPNGAPTVYGVIYLKDIVKGGLADRFARFRAMGIRTVMITGDNKLTASAIAAEAGVDDFLAQATPEDKLALIRKEQQGGRLVAMTGDGTNDAPALAQADVGVAMNTGTQAAKEAGNMVDLDSNPTKLIEIVEIGKQLLMTRGALTTFSIANDVAKYFAIIPAMLMVTFPAVAPLNVMHLASPEQRHSQRGDLQRLDHHSADSARASWRAIPPNARDGAAAAESADLRRGRNHRSVRRHQGHRYDHHVPSPHLIHVHEPILKEIKTTVSITLVLLLICCCIYPVFIFGAGQLFFPQKADGSLVLDSSGKPIASTLLAPEFHARTSTSIPGPRLRERATTRPVQAAAIMARRRRLCTTR